MKGGCTLLSPPNFTLRGYSGSKDKTRTTGDPKRVAACCQDPEILPDARTQSGFAFEEPLLAEFPSRIRATAARVAVKTIDWKWRALND